jgi:outer membrane protein
MKTKVIISVLFLMTAASAVQAEGLKIGYLDLQRVIIQSDTGKEAHERYMTRARKYKEEIDNRSESLKSLKNTIEAATKELKAGEAIPATLINKDKEYGVQARELQRLLGGYQEELKVLDAELARTVLEQFSPILADFAKRNGYDYIIRGLDSLAYANERLDVTEALIKEFNVKRVK